MSAVPRWAQRLRDRHPEGEVPTRDHPIPTWLEEEARRVPLWYIIREATTIRTSHPFLVLKEILRQPAQWAEIVEGYWPRVDQVADVVQASGVDRVILAGCGSAFFTAVHGAFVLARVAGLAATAVESWELTHYSPPDFDQKTLVIGHSGTGGSIETVQTMEQARRRGCLTLTVTNTEDSPLGRASDLSLIYATRQECGPCISVVSTRILLVTMLAIALGKRRGRSGNDLSILEDALRRVSSLGAAFLDDEHDHVRALARKFREMNSFFLLGSGPNYFSAREGTLKIEEQAIVVAKAYRSGEFHHDALALVGPDKVVIAIEAGRPANDRLVDALRAAREAGSPTLAVLWSGDSDLARHADDHLQLHGVLPELITPIPLTLPFQLFGYYLGVERGYNPDTLRTDHWPNARAWLTSFPLGTH